MKLRIIPAAIILAMAILFSAGFAGAQTAQSRNSYTQQLIQVLEKIINLLEQRIQQLLAQRQTVPPASPACTPNWQCQWGACVNGYQSQAAVDSNNCGLPASGAGIACPALAQACNSVPPVSGNCNARPDANGNCPSGCVNYGNPLGCVTQEYYNYCNLNKGKCPL